MKEKSTREQLIKPIGSFLGNPRLHLAALYGFSFGVTIPAYDVYAETLNKQGCNVKLLVIGMTVLDNPLIPNRIGLTDKDDFVVGPPADFGEAVVLYEEREVGRANLLNRENYARVLFDGINKQPNAKGRNGLDALRLGVYFAKDRVRQIDGSPVTQQVTIQCGRPGWVHAGRYPTERGIDATISGRFPIRKVGTVVDTAFQQFFHGFTTGMAPQEDNTGQNLEDIRRNLQQIKEDVRNIREKETQNAKTPTPIPPAPAPVPEVVPEVPEGKGYNLPPSNDSLMVKAAGILNENIPTASTLAALVLAAGYGVYRRFRH